MEKLKEEINYVDQMIDNLDPKSMQFTFTSPVRKNSEDVTSESDAEK